MGARGSEAEAVVAAGLMGRWRRRGRAHDESALIGEARRGSPEALETLIARHWDGAFRTAILILDDPRLAEDVAQEAMLAALASLATLEDGRPFSPWLRRIAANRAIDQLRRASSRFETTVAEVRGVDVPAPAPDGLPDDLVQAIRTLEARDRTIIALRFLAELSSAEIAEALGMTPTAVRSRQHRALAALRIELGEDEA